MTTPVLIAVAPNGARKGRADHPAVPLTTEEIAATAAACARAGAALLHMHVRDGDGGYSLDPGRYREAIAATREAAGAELVIQITTEAAGRFAPDQQMACVTTVEPEACSVALRELCPDDAAGTVGRFRDFLGFCADRRIVVQHILYDAADLRRLLRLRNEGVIADASPALFVLGRYAAGDGDGPAALLPFLTVLGEEGSARTEWSVCAFGQAETRSLAVAMGLGGDVRVGFENSLLAADGSVAPSNEARVAAIAAIATALGRPPLTPAALRRRWDLAPASR
jgi:uncharacterized protein (DUF849 family)